MDIAFQLQSDERDIKVLWRRYFFYVYTPWVVRNLFLGGICVMIALFDLLPPERLFWVFLAAILLIVAVSAFPLYWRRMRRLLQDEGAFDTASEWHLTDTWFELRRGCNCITTEYRIYSHFFRYRNTIYLLRRNLLGAVFGERHFPDGGQELIRCLRECGVRELKFWSWRRWCVTLVFVVLMSLLFGWLAVMEYTSSQGAFHYREALPPETLRLSCDAGFRVENTDAPGVLENSLAVIKYLDGLAEKPTAIAIVEVVEEQDPDDLAALQNYALRNRIRFFYITPPDAADPDAPVGGYIFEYTEE